MHQLSQPGTDEYLSRHHRQETIPAKLLCWAGILIAAEAFVLLFASELTQLSSTTLIRLSVIVAGLTIIVHARIAPRRIWSVSTVFLVVFALFHFGLLFVMSIGAPIHESVLVSVDRWFYTDSTSTAIVLSTGGMLACSLGITIALLYRRNKSKRDEAAQPASEDDHVIESAIQPAGIAVLTISLLGWFYIVVSTGGFALLTGSYTEFLDATARRPLPYAYLGIGLGMAFIATGAASNKRRAGLLLFAIWALIAVPLGLRGEVLFPLVSFLAITAMRATTISFTKALVIALAVLSLAAFVRELRQVGVSEVTTVSFSAANPMNAIAEMGGSLRPVVEVLNWQQVGDERLGGATYFAPVERASARFIPFIDPPVDARDDARLSNVVVQDRVGPIGFSPIAEAARNFGLIGVVAVMLFIGLVLGIIDTWPPTAIRQGMSGVILVPLLNHVRNAFTPVPAHILFGTVILLAIVVIAPLLAKRTRRERSPIKHAPVTTS